MTDMGSDMFLDREGRGRLLRGATIYSDSTWIAELAGRVGFDVVWLEMEHGGADFKLVESLTLAAEAGGAIAAVRVSGNERTYILRALEVGARMVIVPMVNSGEEAAAIVEAGKFRPIGNRGYSTRTRGVRYGLDGASAAFAGANARIALLAQIETMEAVGNLEDICGVAGLDGVFIGPGDLSASMGCMGDLANAELISTVRRCVRTARECGKHAGILVGPGPMLDAAVDAGCDLVFAGGDITNLAGCWDALLQKLPGELRS